VSSDSESAHREDDEEGEDEDEDSSDESVATPTRRPRGAAAKATKVFIKREVSPRAPGKDPAQRRGSMLMPVTYITPATLSSYGS
jgi:hypothetical protein